MPMIREARTTWRSFGPDRTRVPVELGSHIGIPVATAMIYNADEHGVSVYEALGDGWSPLGSEMAFTDEDRLLARGGAETTSSEN
jgi:hypothetical protein